MARSGDSARGERGQVLVVFALALVAIVAMIGLVLDGGSTFAQRRDEQTVSDLASLAGATAYLNASGDHSARSVAADAAARVVATANGYTTGTDGVTVAVDIVGTSAYSTIRVTVTKPHRNNFSGVVGMSSWDVTATAQTEVTAKANGVVGAMPLLFNEEAFPTALCDESSGTCTAEVYQLPGSGNEDVPQDATQFNWTIFCEGGGTTGCNGDSDGVDDIMDGNGTGEAVYLTDDLGPLNAGSHTDLFNDLEAFIGGIFPVPVVDDDGVMVGFAYFKLLSVEGSSVKSIRGYFVSPVRGAELVYNPDKGDATLNTGAFLIKLID
jgi:hypothetical protein